MKLAEFAARSRATPAFLDALATFRGNLAPTDRIRFDPRSPAVKVERTLTQLLARHPELEIERVSIDARSGCEFFRGVLTVVAGQEQHRLGFHWDCRRKAEQEGFKDYFGYPDQIRDAQEFGYDCFREWGEIEAPRDVAAA